MLQTQNFHCQSTSNTHNENINILYIKVPQTQNTQSEIHQNLFILFATFTVNDTALFLKQEPLGF